MSPYLLAAPPVAVVSYALGWASCLLYQHRKLTREVVVEARSFRRGLERVNEWVSHWLALLAALVLASVLFVYVSSSRHHSQDQAGLREQNRCLTTFANQLHDSLVPRQRASKQLQHADNMFNVALLRLFQDALVKQPDQKKAHADVLAIKDALVAKTSLAASLNAERAANPYPSPPKKVCPK